MTCSVQLVYGNNFVVAVTFMLGVYLERDLNRSPDFVQWHGEQGVYCAVV